MWSFVTGFLYLTCFQGKFLFKNLRWVSVSLCCPHTEHSHQVTTDDDTEMGDARAFLLPQSHQHLLSPLLAGLLWLAHCPPVSGENQTHSTLVPKPTGTQRGPRTCVSPRAGPLHGAVLGTPPGDDRLEITRGASERKIYSQLRFTFPHRIKY